MRTQRYLMQPWHFPQPRFGLEVEEIKFSTILLSTYILERWYLPPCATPVSRAGSSTNTTSPKLDCACSVTVIVPRPVSSSYDTVSCSGVYLLAITLGQTSAESWNSCVLMSVRNWGVNRRVLGDGNALRGADTREREDCLRVESIVQYWFATRNCW